jgi:uncharacterized protein YndB with AHSA1/START domain
MTVTSVDKDLENLTLTVTADFDAPVEKVWQLWADPRKLERWWGPPTYPATVDKHELSPGGDVSYYMTSPEGEQHRGWWRVTAVQAPTSLDFNDGFADKDGNPAEGMPVNAIQMRLTERDGGTRMEIRSIFNTQDQMEQLTKMGMEEGLRQSVGQIDALLAE